MIEDTNVVLAGFGEAGRLALRQLLNIGFASDQFVILTYEDERNERFQSLIDDVGVEYTTADIESDEVSRKIDALEPELLLSVYYRDIVPESILRRFTLGGVNVHPSPLPKYAGTFSIPWMIINGEDEAAFTYHYMIAEVDKGPIILQEPLDIRPNDTAYSLYHRVMYAALRKLPRVLELVIEDEVQGREQEGEQSYYPRELPYGGRIDRSWDEAFIERFIRAMYFPPFEPASVDVDGEEFHVNTYDEYTRLVKDD